MLVTILGGLGSGKTLLLVILAYYQKRKIVTNFTLDFPSEFEIEEFSEDKFLRAEYEDCIILLDEAYSYLESRLHASEKNQIMSYILFQSRKKNVVMYLTLQLLSSLEKRYRELSDIFIIANCNDKYSDFEYTILMKNKPNIQYYLKFNRSKALLFGKMYNTNEVIVTTNQKILFDIKEPEDKEAQIMNYVEEIKKFYFSEGYESITKNMIDLYITKHKKIPKFLAKDIFTEISMEKKLDREKTKKKQKKK